jgi:hypothetical protein
MSTAACLARHNVGTMQIITDRKGNLEISRALDHYKQFEPFLYVKCGTLYDILSYKYVFLTSLNLLRACQ